MGGFFNANPDQRSFILSLEQVTNLFCDHLERDQPRMNNELTFALGIFFFRFNLFSDFYNERDRRIFDLRLTAQVVTKAH
jgi:hypothetical protein